MSGQGTFKEKSRILLALRSALSAPVSLMGLQLAKLLGGTAIVESIFALPGLGRLFLTAVEMRDLNLVQGIVIPAPDSDLSSRLPSGTAFRVREGRI